jgi:hypothetical protein
MRRWKRVVLGLCILAAASVALILWNIRDGRTPSLSISLVGYTNRTVFPGDESSTAPLAMLRASNSGPVALKMTDLSGFSWSTNDNRRSGTIMEAPFYPSPPILEPGETFSFEMYPPPNVDFLGGEATFHRWGLHERVSQWVWSAGNSTVRRWVDRISPTVELSKVTFGPLTNQPPATVQVKADE